ncbi:hypothetical protein ANCCEY_11150 [Ancylostoma ceylanicum]|uniref:Amino acid permease n=1 Tax=Ancylostoma ceylanicum TaxID=53326 RepID=A0A0D6LEY0_9BILA|nr:hypothetical protein ANCCEY_11150 [Ancylostoma ceylanicum]
METLDSYLDMGQNEPSQRSDSSSTAVKLQQRISLFNGCTIIVGVIVGSGIFVSPKGVLREAGSVGLSLAFGPLPAFLFLWMALVIINPTSNAIIALTFANYSLKPFFPSCEVPEAAVTLLAACTIALLTFINCYNVRLATRFNDTFTIAKVAALVCIIITGLIWLAMGHTEYFRMPDLLDGSQTEPSTLTLAFYSGVFSYTGFSYLNFVTEELKDPYRNLPRAIYISLPAVTLIYMFVNMAYFAVLSIDEILESDAVAVTFAKKVMGPFAPLVPLFVACSCIGSLNGILFTSSRMFFAGASSSVLIMTSESWRIPNSISGILVHPDHDDLKEF